MPNEDPVACTLSAAEMPERLAEIRTIGREALLSSDTIAPRSALLRFRASPATRARLQAIIAAEAECCAFLRFALADEPGAVLLTISAPEGGEPVMQDLVSAFGGASPAA